MCSGAYNCPYLSGAGGKEVGNGVEGADELYADNGYDYYTNQAISQ